MFGDKVLELIRELKRSADGNLPPFNVSCILIYCGKKITIVEKL